MSNVLLFFSDEHNPFYSSPYGHPTVQTPNMEALARRGVLFHNAYTPSPLCLPCRSAIMTGRRVHEIQAYSNCTVALKKDWSSWGSELRRQGVHTAYMGKVDVYDDGANLGFSEMVAPQDRGYPGDTCNRRRPLRIREGAHKRANGFGPHPDPFDGDDQAVDEAEKWLLDKAPQLGKPWVLAVNLNAPHFPHYSTQELWDLYPNGGDLPKFGPECESARHPYAQDLCRHFETALFSEEQVRGLRRGYLACITYVDRQLGRLMNALESAGLLTDTDVIYSSDHGEMLGKFGMWWKCSLYEDSVRVPLIAAGPDFTGGTEVATPVDLQDLQATLFRCTGATMPADRLGKPIQDIAPNDPNRVVFSEYHGHGTRSGAFMIRKGDWKLIYCAEAPHLLFNLSDDPDELKDLSAQFPGKMAEMERELRKICDPEKENDRAHEFEERQFEILGRTANDAPVAGGGLPVRGGGVKIKGT